MKKIVKWLIWLPALAFYLYMSAFEMPKASRHLADVSQNAECATPPDIYFMNMNADRLSYSFYCMGEKGIEKYIHISRNEDTLYPISYGLFYGITLYFLISFTVPQKRVAWSLALIPIIAAVADLYENMNLVELASSYPELERDVIVRAKTGNIWKWLFVILNGAALLIFGFRSLFTFIGKRR